MNFDNVSAEDIKKVVREDEGLLEVAPVMGVILDALDDSEFKQEISFAPVLMYALTLMKEVMMEGVDVPERIIIELKMRSLAEHDMAAEKDTLDRVRDLIKEGEAMIASRVRGVN